MQPLSAKTTTRTLRHPSGSTDQQRIIILTLDLEEYSVAIQKPQKQPFGQQNTEGQNQGLKEFCMLSGPQKEEFGNSVEVNKSLQEVYRNRIHPNNNKEKRPLPVSLNVNYPVE